MIAERIRGDLLRGTTVDLGRAPSLQRIELVGEEALLSLQ
jgi:hypothetical protein